MQKLYFSYLQNIKTLFLKNIGTTYNTRAALLGGNVVGSDIYRGYC